MSRSIPINLSHGQAGVYRVASELMLRGYNPCIPAVDIGADLVLQDGTRIQVKTAKLRIDKLYKTGAYWFKLGRTERVKNQQIFRTRRTFSNECDFVILFGIDESRFWIVPAMTMDNHQLIVVGPKIHHKNIDIEEIKNLRQAGFTQEEIANKTSVSTKTIARRLSGEFTEPQKTNSSKVRVCEDRWDIIAEFTETKAETNNGIILEFPVKEAM